MYDLVDLNLFFVYVVRNAESISIISCLCSDNRNELVNWHCVM